MELLLEKSRAARKNNKHEEAFDISTRALRTIDGKLEREFWFEIAVCAWYVDAKDIGFHYLNRLLLHPQVSSDTKRLMKKNALFYVKSLAEHFSPRDEIPFFLGQSLKSEKVNITNPSIIAIDGGYLATCRSVNYNRDPKTHRFSFLGDAKGYDSHTYLLWLDEKMNLLETAEVTGERLRSAKPIARGIEDARLFLFQDQVWFACTFPDAFEKTRTGLVHIGKIPDILEAIKTKHIVAEACFTLNGPPTRHEKNWIPFVTAEQKIVSIYSFEPLVILEPDLNFKDLEMTTLPNFPRQFCQTRKKCEKQGRFDLSGCRGGSCGIPWPIGDKKGLLFVVHEVDEKFHYLHRFVLFDSDSQDIIHVSLPFYIEKLGVEYCAGMCFTHDKKSVILSYGLGDYAAKYTLIRVADVQKFILSL